MKDWSEKEINLLAKLYPTKPLSFIAKKLKRTESACRTKAIKLKIKKEVHASHVFTDDKKKVLFDLYPDTKNVDIAKTLGTTVCSIIAAGFRYKLRKSKEFKRIHAEKGQFKKGQKVWNKGIKGLQIGGKETQFKKGQAPINHRPVGSERLTKDGYIEIKVSEPNKWQSKHSFEWEKIHGKVPKGFIVVFKSDDKMNTSPDNIELISRSENIKRNTVHNYPKDIALAVQLRGALNRQINKHKKKLYEK